LISEQHLNNLQRCNVTGFKPTVHQVINAGSRTIARERLKIVIYAVTISKIKRCSTFWELKKFPLSEMSENTQNSKQ